MKLSRITFLLAVASMIACSNNNTTFDVTYQITVNSMDSCNLFVSYIDSTGYKSFHLKEKTWSKQVTIPSQQGIASLLIIPQNRDMNMDIDIMEIIRPRKIVVQASITHESKHVEKTQTGTFSVEMIDPNFRRY